jgi:hypothetical protein
MPFAEVSDILFLSDSFLTHITLDKLRMLASTNREIHTDIFGDSKSSKKKGSIPVIEHALVAMAKVRPNNWKLSFKEAKYRFSLQRCKLIKHCRLLPTNDPFHMDIMMERSLKAGYTNGRIRFIDAFKLASISAGGLKAAMKRRHEMDVKVLDSARKLLTNLESRMCQMRINVKKAIQFLKQSVTALREGVTCKRRVSGETELHRGIRILEQLNVDVSVAVFDVFYIEEQLGLNQMQNIMQIKERTHHLEGRKACLFGRYRYHRVFCPDILVVDFL